MYERRAAYMACRISSMLSCEVVFNVTAVDKREPKARAVVLSGNVDLNGQWWQGVRRRVPKNSLQCEERPPVSRPAVYYAGLVVA